MRRPTTTTIASRRSPARWRSGSTTSPQRGGPPVPVPDRWQRGRPGLVGLRGGALALNPPAVDAAADFIVRVSLWAEAPAAAGAGTELPANFTQPYRLTVSQSQP